MKRKFSLADTDSLGVGSLPALPLAADTDKVGTVSLLASGSLPASGGPNAEQALKSSLPSAVDPAPHGTSKAGERFCTEQNHREIPHVSPDSAAGLPDQSTWYATTKPRSGKQKHCQCTGNCLSKCPARYTQCPNAATVNLQKHARSKPLCKVCSCHQPDCTTAARRPYGQFAFKENYGYCPRHYPRRPAA